MTRTRIGTLVALGVVAILVTLPIADHYWSQWRLDRAGVDTTAEVIRTEVLEPGGDQHYLVEFRLDEELVDGRPVWPVEVDRDAYEAAEADGTIEVRVVPGRPSVHEVEGQTDGSTGLIMLLIIDVLLVLVALVVWRARGPGGSEEEPDQA
ncbi:hypothetical protein FXB39_04815 [Nocardioides sp. BGMRC 2183]|nr:hypothetical protein FXB39_04815 [Nocardioides sp. BGMRC 2183]